MSDPSEIEPATLDERQLVARLHTAAKTMSAYPVGHPATASLARAVWRDLMAVADGSGRVELRVSEDELFINGRTAPSRDRNAHGLFEVMFARDIQRITVGPELDERGVEQLLRLLSQSVDALEAQGGIDAVVRHLDAPGLAIHTVRYERRLIEGTPDDDVDSRLAELAAPLLRRSLSAMGYVDPDAVLSVIEQPREVLRIADGDGDGGAEAKRVLRASRSLVAAVLSLVDADEELAQRLAAAVSDADPRLAELVTARLGLSSAMQAAESLTPVQIAQMIERTADAGMFDTDALEQELEDMATAAMLMPMEEGEGPFDPGEGLWVGWDRLDVRQALADELTEGGADPVSQARILAELLRHERDPDRYRELAEAAVETVQDMIAAGEYEVADEVLEVLSQHAGEIASARGLVSELAARAVNAICTPSAAEFLLTQLAYSHSRRDKAALRSLLARFGRAALSPLEHIVLTGEPHSTLADAAQLLLQVRAPEAEELVTRLLRRAPRESRWEIIQAAGRDGGPRALRVLIDVMTSGRVPERQEALRLVGRLQAEKAVPVIGEAARRPGWLDRRARLREEAVRALAAIGTAEACEALESVVYARAMLAPWRSGRVQRAAMEALCDLDSHSAREALDRIAGHGHRWAKAIANRRAQAGDDDERRTKTAEFTPEGAESTS
ncbi:MAG: HEAT repeat domain-containing protein [Armatimonadota bacterium]